MLFGGVGVFGRLFFILLLLLEYGIWESCEINLRGEGLEENDSESEKEVNWFIGGVDL